MNISTYKLKIYAIISKLRTSTHFFSGYICRNEMMVPKWTYLDQENSQNKIHSYDPATMEQFSLYPLLKDPLEDYYLDVFPR